MDLRSIINAAGPHDEITIVPPKEDVRGECPTCRRLFAPVSPVDEDNRTRQLKQSKDLVQELTEGLEDASRGEAEARGEVELLRGEVAALKKETTDLETKNKKYSRLVEELEDQLASNFDEHQIAGNQLEEANAAHARVKTELEATKEEYATLQAKFDEESSSISKELEEKNAEIRGLKAIIHSLSRSLVPEATSAEGGAEEKDFDLLSAKYEQALRTLAELQDAVDEPPYTKAAWGKRIEDAKREAITEYEAAPKAAQEAKAAEEKAAWERKIEEKQARLDLEAALMQATEEAAELARQAAKEITAWEKKPEGEKKAAMEEDREQAMKAQEAAERMAAEKALEEKTKAMLAAQMARINHLEEELAEAKLVDEWERKEQQYRQYMESIQLEKEEMVRSHTIETSDLRKNIRFLTEKIYRQDESQENATANPNKEVAGTSPPRSKTTRELLNESEERESVLKGEIASLQTRLSTAQRDQFQLDEERTEVRQLLAAEEDNNAQSARNVESLQEKAPSVTSGSKAADADTTDEVDHHKKQVQTNEAYQRAVRELDGVIVALANGDLTQKIMIQPEELGSDIATLKRSINIMVDELQVIAFQVSGVARQVGKEGMLGGQVQLPNASGIWKEMVDNVNQLAHTLTSQVRSIATVTQAARFGDFTHKVRLECQGETLVLTETVNGMIDRLNEVVTGVANLGHNAAIEGALGGQVVLETELQGMWKTMVDNANAMADTLTDQTRSLSIVASKITHGDIGARHGFPPSGAGEIQVLYETMSGMLDELRDNWTRRTDEEGTEGGIGLHDQKLQQERLQRIWTILHSNI